MDTGPRDVHADGPPRLPSRPRAVLLVALGRPALAQRCLSFRPPAFFAGAALAPGYPYPVYGYPVYPYCRFPLPPAPSLAVGRVGIDWHVLVGRYAANPCSYMPPRPKPRL